MLKKKEKNFNIVNIYIKSTLNNTIITVTNLFGNVLFSASAGLLGFKGSRKNTPYVIQNIVKYIIEKLKLLNIKKINIIIKGKGIGREPIIRTFKYLEFDIISIFEKTTISYNGCRLPKKRRL